MNLFKITEKMRKIVYKINRHITKLKQEPISCRADNALAARSVFCGQLSVCFEEADFFYLAAYIDNNVMSISEMYMYLPP